MLKRRAVIGGLALAPLAARARSPGAALLLRRAISAMGGEAALRAAPILRWTGEATVYAGERTVEIGCQTVVEPFSYYRSRTWLKERPMEVRELLIDGDEGIAIINAQHRPMPGAMRDHERDQYSLYGLMRLVPLLDGGADPVPAAPDEAALRVARPDLPETTLVFDAATTRLLRAENRVRGDAGGALVAQTIRFSDSIDGGGLTWPRVVEIEREGLPYLRLMLTTFQPGRTRDLPVSKAA
ncbi:MAG: hypothetical protein RQ833_05660 [Sphingomonadaceae bacterium]|nr:hypothetical protein [Sphingomonadaceae bacterium]